MNANQLLHYLGFALIAASAVVKHVPGFEAFSDPLLVAGSALVAKTSQAKL